MKFTLIGLFFLLLAGSTEITSNLFYLFLILAGMFLSLAFKGGELDV